MGVSRLKTVVLPCLLFLAVTVPHLGQGDFRKDTGRYAAVGRYMWVRNCLWKPYINPNTPYFSKPPLALVIHGAFLKLFGVSVAVARAPSIIAGLGIIALTVLAAREVASRAEAVASGIILALTYEFFRRTREISLDMWQLVFLMAAAYLVLTGARRGQRFRLVLAGIPVGLALLCKPFMALGVLPILAVWLWHMRRKDFIWILFAATLTIALLVAFPWHYAMWHEFGTAFVDRYLGREVLARAHGRLQTNPPWYFVVSLAGTYWPWALALAYAVWKRWSNGARAPLGNLTSAHESKLTVSNLHSGTVPLRAGFRCRLPRRDLVLLGGTWALLVLILLSVFPDKKINYALPLYPMLAWVAAAGVCRLPWKWLRSWYRRGLPWIAPMAIGLIALLSLAPVTLQKPAQPEWQEALAWMKDNHVSSADMGYEGLTAEDICYVYLYTGEWLAVADGKRLALKHSKASEPGEIFRAGDLVVLDRSKVSGTPKKI